MKILFLLACSLLFSTTDTGWQTDFARAQAEARQSKKYILLNFSGSDWCGPCIRMHKELFSSAEFGAFAAGSLVLVNADFPRLKKNALDKALQQQNERLADRYNKEGHFPYTVLLDADGKVLRSWDGFPKESPSQFVANLKSAVHAQ